MSHGLRRTIKHDVVRAWADARGGEPARVRGTTDALKIRIGAAETGYESFAWKDWLAVFDEKELAFVYEDPGFTYKVVRRNGHEDGAKTDAAG